ncbi:MAG: hypothetical protein ACLRL4_04570 [Bifidobacterium bifidum]
MAAFSLGGSHATRLFFGFPLVQQRSGGNSSRSRSKGSTLSGVGFSKERISQYRKQGLSDERISKLWQDTLKMRALMKKRKEQESTILKPAFLSHGRTPRHAETGRSTSGSTTNGTDTAVQAGNGRSRFFLSASLLERRWIVRNLFQRAGNAVRNVAGRIRSAFSRGSSRSSGS